MILFLLDEEQRLALFHRVAVLEQDLFQEAFHPGAERHGVKGRGVAGEFQVIGHRLFQGLTYRHLGGRRRHIGIFVAAGQGQDQERHRDEHLQGAAAAPDWASLSLNHGLEFLLGQYAICPLPGSLPQGGRRVREVSFFGVRKIIF